MGTEISGVAKSVLQARCNGNFSPIKEESNPHITVSFMELMGQNTLSSGANASVFSSHQEMITEDVRGDVRKTAYDTCSSKTKSVSIKRSISPEEVQSVVKKPMDEYESRIKELLQKELGVTEEEISEAVETLGITFFDLRNMQNLAALIQSVTGEDIGALFLSESFQTIMEQISVLTEELCAELGITKEELDAICSMMYPEESNESVISESMTNDLVDVESVQQTTEDAGQEQLTETNQSGAEVLTAESTEVMTNENTKTLEKHDTEQSIINPEEVQQTSDELNVLETSTEQTGVTIDGKSENEQLNTVVDEKSQQSIESVEAQQLNDDSQQEFAEDSGEAFHTDSSLNVSMNGNVQQTAGANEFVIPQESMMPYTHQTNAADLIRQIAQNVRVTISATTTSMEMQLNPENLGKLYLNISEHEGVVRAQITTQTETVREALETQLVELRQSLSQQGVKVEAIEVSVATHEFEQNLEGQAKQEEQMHRQMEESQQQNRKNLNLDDMDGLSGLMSEEEQLAAQIMRDNGNQVNLTA